MSVRPLIYRNVGEGKKTPPSGPQIFLNVLFPAARRGIRRVPVAAGLKPRYLPSGMESSRWWEIPKVRENEHVDLE